MVSLSSFFPLPHSFFIGPTVINIHSSTSRHGTWYAAYERLLSVVDVLRAAGLRTKRHYVASSRGRRRGDLEVRDANVADKAHLILDVAMSMNSTAPATTSVAMARLGMLKTPTACFDAGKCVSNAACSSIRIGPFFPHRTRVGVPGLCTSDGGCCSSTPSSAVSGRHALQDDLDVHWGG